MWYYNIKQFELNQGRNATWHPSPSRNQCHEIYHVPDVFFPQNLKCDLPLLHHFPFTNINLYPNHRRTRCLDPPRDLLQVKLDDTLNFLLGCTRICSTSSNFILGKGSSSIGSSIGNPNKSSTTSESIHLHLHDSRPYSMMLPTASQRIPQV